MSSAHYSSYDSFNNHIDDILRVCRDDPNIQGLMLVGSIGRKEEDQQSDINVEIFIDGAQFKRYVTGGQDLSGKLKKDLFIYYKDDSMVMVFDDLVVLTAKFVAIETAKPEAVYLVGQILIDKKMALVTLLQKAIEQGGKWDEERIERSRAEIRKLLLDVYYEFKRNNFWEGKKLFSEIRLYLAQLYTSKCGLENANVRNLSELAEDWFVSGLQRIIISNLSSVPRAIHHGLILLNEIERHCHMKEMHGYKEFDLKLNGLIKEWLFK